MKTVESRQKLQGLQALRGFAFLGIFLDHANLGLKFITGRQVSIFIVMSGFLLVLNYYDKDLPCSFFENLKYSIKKIKRLYPLHILSMLLLLALFLYFSFSDPQTFGTPGSYVVKALLNIFLLQSFVPINSYCISLNGVAWYLSTLVFLYFIFPAILKFIKRNYSVKKAVLFSLCAYACMLAIAFFTRDLTFAGEDLHGYLTYICPFYRAFDFFIGCNLGFVYLNRKNTSGKQTTGLELLSVLCFVISAMLLSFFGDSFLGCLLVSPVLWLPVALLWVWCFANGNGLFERLLSAKPFQALGNISGYTFLIHYVVLVYVASLLRFLFNGYENNLITALISIVLTIFAGFLYKKLFAGKSA